MEIKSKAHTFKHGQEHILRIDKLSILDIISFKYISKTCGQTKHQKKKTNSEILCKELCY